MSRERLPVLLDNDVNIMALGELHAGVARQVGDFLLLKIGTGIGCGIVVDGKIYRGVSGSAGDIGHMGVDELGPLCACGNTGCLEAYFGGAALAAAKAQTRGALRKFPLPGRTPGRGRNAVRRGRGGGGRPGRRGGDPAHQGRRPPRGPGSRRPGRFFNPGLVIIAGGVARLGHLLLAEIRSVVYRRSLPLATGNLPIVLSGFGDSAGVIGSARLISGGAFHSGLTHRRARLPKVNCESSLTTIATQGNAAVT